MAKMTTFREFVDEVYDRTFSSFCFGGVFGTWLIVTIVLGWQRGWMAVGTSLLLYVCTFSTLMFIGWLFNLGAK